MMTVLKMLGSALLLFALLSVDFIDLRISMTLLRTPVQLTIVAFVDTLLLGYFVTASRWSDWREWVAVFSVMYGVNYLLTAMESIYLGGILSAKMVTGILANGAISSAVFAAVLVWVLGKKGGEVPKRARLAMRGRDWAWKIVGSGAVYVLLFVLFGFAIYYPLARALDPAGLASEQSIASSSATLILPVEVVRGAIWALLAVPAIAALRLDRRRTALTVGMLFAVPMSGSILLSTTMAPGLQMAHLAEVFGENLAFGLLVTWILHPH